jgi:hypothetical protein
MSVEAVLGNGDQDGKFKTFASARDVGNLAAGFMAGLNGVSEPSTRFAFDLIESWQRRKRSTEGMPTQQAESLGYKFGFKIFSQKSPLRAMLNS